MKRHLKYMILGCALLVAAGCKESLPPHFDDITGIYLNNLLPNRAHTDSVSLTFIYEDKDEMEVPVRLQLLGRTAETARPVTVSILSDNADAGRDYEAPSIAELPANATAFDYVIKLKRTADLKKETKKLIVRIEANDYFILPFESIIQSGGQETSVVDFIIEYSDQFTAPPVGWNEMFAGKFTQQKFELITRVMDIPRNYFNDKNKISPAKWIYIQEQMTLYVRGEQKKKDQGLDYDPEAFDANGDALTFI